MTRELPEQPNLEHLKNQAKQLLQAIKKNDPDALARAAPYAKAPFKLAGAQLVIAREYGFDSWPQLKKHVESLREDPIDLFLDAVCEGRQGRAEEILAANPDLPRRSAVVAAVAGDGVALKGILAADPSQATKPTGPKSSEPILYASFSKFDDARVTDCARILLDNGGDPNAHYRDPDWPDAKLPPLWAATCEGRNPSLARLLLERGANVDDGESVYHSAQYNLTDMLDLLVEFGANFTGPFQPWGNTPLYFLMGYRPGSVGYDEAMSGVRCLLEHGADPNARSYKVDETALHGAVRVGHGPEVVKMMLEHGADPNARRADGKTAFQLSARQGRSDIMAMMESFGGDTTMLPADQYLFACASGGRELAKRLIAEHPGLSDRLTAADRAAIVEAASHGNAAAVSSLLVAGFDAGTTDEEGITALHWACWNGWDAIVSVLLEHGAPVEVKDGVHDGTPLGWCIHGAVHCKNAAGDYPSVVRRLIAAGATPSPEVLATAPPEIAEALRGPT